MKFRVDLVAHSSMIVEATDEYAAERLAVEHANGSPSFRATFEVEDGGIEAVDGDTEEPDIREDNA